MYILCIIKCTQIIIYTKQRNLVCINIQGDPKVLDTFVFVIYSKSLGAQKKLYCQIKAEILKFMWICEKS
jgi:hypothetical protein